MSAGQAATVPAVPYRMQKGSACAFYALGMLMDFWHSQDSKNVTALVRDKDKILRALEPGRYAFQPTTEESILSYSQLKGFTVVCPIMHSTAVTDWYTCAGRMLLAV